MSLTLNTLWLVQWEIDVYDILFCISSPYAYIDPLHANMNSLFVELFKDSLNEYAYDAAIAGLIYNLANSVEICMMNILLQSICIDYYLGCIV